jgi:2-keto-4-pentenoate hydratase
MIDDAERERELEVLAQALAEAAVTRRPIEPIGAGRPWLGAAEAYAIQRRIVGPRIAGGDTVVGWKVGLTSRAMQEQLGVDQPDYAALLASMRVEDGAPIELATLIQPRIEAEIAFLLARPLRGPGVTREHVLAATAAVLPSFEVIDSRIADWRIGLVDTVADVASSARFVLGPDRVAPGTLDLASIEVIVTRNGAPVASGQGSAVLGDPAIAVAWAANTLGALGETLEAGHVILPGAVHASVPAFAGDAFEATFSGLGSVRATFA